MPFNSSAPEKLHRAKACALCGGALLWACKMHTANAPAKLLGNRLFQLFDMQMNGAVCAAGDFNIDSLEWLIGVHYPAYLVGLAGVAGIKHRAVWHGATAI